MSPPATSFETPPPVRPSTEVSPGGSAQPSAVRFFDETELLVISTLVAPEDSDTMTAALDALFRHFGARSFVDLAVFSNEDVSKTLTLGETATLLSTSLAPLRTPICLKRLGFIVDFAKHSSSLDGDTSMAEIIKMVTNPPASSTATRGTRAVTFSTPNSPSDSKKTVPALPKFSGNAEDYFSWAESTTNMLGQAGLSGAISRSEYRTSHMELSISIFYGLRAALQDGHAKNHAQNLFDKNDCDAYKLWTVLESYYDTDLNRANVVLFEVKRLLGLRLDASISATAFISDFNDSVLRLSKSNATIASDNDTLRALLLVAIQDESFDTVRDEIVRDPSKTAQEILSDIRKRESSLQLKDGVPLLRMDGSPPARLSRRTNINSQPSKFKNRQGSGAIRPWNIPFFPRSWKQAFGKSLFQLMLNWRKEAHGKVLAPDKLNTAFETVVEKFQPSKSNSSPLQHSKRSRRASSSSSSASSPGPLQQEASKTDQQDSESGTDTESAPRRKRIRLQKSRRVVTEHS